MPGFLYLLNNLNPLEDRFFIIIFYYFICKYIFYIKMPAKREPILNGLSISIPGFVRIYKILFIAVLIFPWYVILSNKNIPGIMFSYLIGKEDIQKSCPS